MPRSPCLSFTALVFFLHACGPAEPPEPTLSSIQARVFDRRCTSSQCHGSEAGGDLSLEEGESWAQLVNVAPDDGAAQEAGLLRVDPGNAENSFLYVICTEQGADYDSRRMPASSVAFLDDGEMDALREWIERGAADD